MIEQRELVLRLQLRIPMPRPNNRIDARKVRETLCVIALLIAVTGWGLLYKASLCQERYLHSPFPVPAKLLTESERSHIQQNSTVGHFVSKPFLIEANLHPAISSLESEPFPAESHILSDPTGELPARRNSRRLRLRAPPLC